MKNLKQIIYNLKRINLDQIILWLEIDYNMKKNYNQQLNREELDLYKIWKNNKKMKILKKKCKK